MKNIFHDIRIASLATCVPSQVVDLKEVFRKSPPAEIDQIIKTTGIRSVRQAEKSVTASDLCSRAAAELLSGQDPSKVDGLVFVSQTRDHVLPATSIILQHKLGLHPDAVCFDVPLGCSGYIYGIFLASMLLSSGSCQRVLVLAGDTSTRMINPEDRSTRMVFGDAGSATLLEKGPDSIFVNLRSDGKGANDLIIPAGGFRIARSPETCIVSEQEPGNFRSAEDLFMDGMAIFNFAIREVPPIIDETLAYLKCTREEVGTYALHQANEFMVRYLGKRLKLSKDQVPVCVEGFGNTGPASIPLLFSALSDDLRSGGRLDKVLMCGFGVGLSWGVAVASLAKTTIHKPVEYN